MDNETALVITELEGIIQALKNGAAPVKMVLNDKQFAMGMDYIKTKRTFVLTYETKM